MAIKYVTINMTFDLSAWAAECLTNIDNIKYENDITDIEISVLVLDMSETTVAELRAVARGTHSQLKNNSGRIYSIERMLKISNKLNVNPARHFVLER